MRGSIRTGLFVAAALTCTAGIGSLAHAEAWSRPGSGDDMAASSAPPAEVVGRLGDVSDDGRWVVFAGRPPVADTRTSTVYLRDRAGADPATALRELTVSTADLRAGDSVQPAISGDGCVVVVVTQYAYDLFRDDDTGDRWDVYRQVLPHCGGTPGEWELVSATTDLDGDVSAGDRTDPASRPAVSASGAAVAYTHRALGPSAELTQVSLVDLTVPLSDPGRSTLAPGTPLAPPANEFVHLGQRQPALSADGATLVFTSDALSDAAEPAWGTGPVPGGAALSQVYLWDREAGPAAVTLVSARDGVMASTGADQPAVSGTGRFVVFRTSAPELLADVVPPVCVSGCPPQIMRLDLQDGALAVVSAVRPVGAAADALPVAGDGPSGSATISDDGSQVAFATRARNLFPVASSTGVEPDDGDVVVAEVDRGVLRRVSVRADDGSPLAGANANPAMSGSGHVVLFDSLSAAALPASAVLSGDASAGGRHVVAVDRPPVLATAAVDVGMVEVGVPGPEWYVAVRNEGPSTFQPATVTSADPQFSVTGGTCSLKLAVPPGESCTVYLVFTPLAEGPVVATVNVADALFGGSRIDITVTGTGGQPTLDPTPAGADFEPTPVGAQSRTVAFDIGNIGFSVADIASIQVVGDHPSDFAVVGGSCAGATLGPISSCAVEVAFTPTEVGYRSAVVRVATSTGQYTAVLVNGVGSREARLVAAQTRVRAGEEIGLGGAGFAPGSTVTIGWADGRGRPITTVANADGGFVATMPTGPNDRAGERVLVAHAGDISATVVVDVVRRRSSSATGL